MSPLRRRRIAWLLGCAMGFVRAVAAESVPPRPLPPLTGELTGNFQSLTLPGAPALHWTLNLRDGANAAERIADIVVDGTGTHARIEWRFDAAGGGTWRVQESQFDLALWFPLLAPQYLPKLASAIVEGHAALTGEGTLHDGKLGGRVHVDLRDGAMHDAAAAWSVTGIGLQGTLAELPGVTTDGPVKLTFREAKSNGIIAHDGVINFAIDAANIVQVASATCTLMDGRVALTPFAVGVARPEVKTNVDFSGVELGRLAAFLPSVLAEARGPVSGQVELTWSLADGLKFANGSLRPRPNETATIKLSPAPGFLTSRLPEKLRERIDLLPKWTGPLRQLFHPKNPAYDTLRDIEMGRMPLEVKTLTIDVQPAGDANGRTARIVVSAKPAGAESAVDAVRFEINVTGPLADFVLLALKGQLSVHLR
jgi:hypothetical protein